MTDMDSFIAPESDEDLTMAPTPHTSSYPTNFGTDSVFQFRGFADWFGIPQPQQNHQGHLLGMAGGAQDKDMGKDENVVTGANDVVLNGQRQLPIVSSVQIIDQAMHGNTSDSLDISASPVPGLPLQSKESKHSKRKRRARKARENRMGDHDRVLKLRARAAKRAELKARKTASKALGLTNATKSKPLTPATDILDAYLAQAPRPISLDHLRDHFAINAAHFRSICADLPDIPENETQSQSKRIFCYFEVLFNKKDDWTDEQLKKEMVSVDKWERRKIKNYRPEWRNNEGGLLSKILRDEGMSSEEKQAKEHSFRQRKTDRKDMVQLLATFGLKDDHEGSPEVPL